MSVNIIQLFVCSVLFLVAFYAAAQGKLRFSLICASFGFLALIAYYFSWIMDDSYISLRYAANLAHGYGLTFNPGQSPVEGFSNPLWTFIIAIPEFFGIRGLYPVKVISGVFALINIPAIYYTAKCLYDDNETACLAVLLTVTFAPFAVWAGAGLETPLFSLLVLLAFYFYLSKKFWVTSIILGLIALTRPEGLVFLPIVAITVTIFEPNKVKNAIATILPATLIIGGYLFFRLLYFGDILPNTYYAKMGGGWEQALAGVVYLVHFTAFSALLLWAVFGIISLHKVISNQGKILLVSMILVYCGFIVSAGFDLPAFRFFANIWPLVALMSAGGFLWLADKLGARWRWVLWILVIVWSTIGAYWLQERNMTGVFTEGVGIRESGAGERDSALAIGLYLKENADPGDKLALIDAGLMPYYSELEVLDVWGLCSEEIADIKYAASRGDISRPEGDKAIRDLFFDYDPDYIALDVVNQTYDEALRLAKAGDYTSLNSHPQFRSINRDKRFGARYGFIEAYPALPVYSILLFERKDN